MSDFEQRWQQLTRQARRFPDSFPVDLPTGFTTRVQALARDAGMESWADLFSLLGLRAVVATAAVFALSAGLVLADWYEDRIEPPTLERVVTSELSWP